MTASNENQDPANLDDTNDRLIDIALREVVGNESPPDLSARILVANVSPAAATVAAASGSIELAEVRAATPEPRTRRRAFWAGLAVAAMLLVGLTLALRSPFEQARKATAHNRGISSEFSSHSGNFSTQSERTEGKTHSRLPSPYYLTDDVEDSISQLSEGRAEARFRRRLLGLRRRVSSNRRSGCRRQRMGGNVRRGTWQSTAGATQF